MRRLTITEEFGLYKVHHDGWVSSGATLESALLKAWDRTVAKGPTTLPLPGPEIRNSHDMAEVLDTILGSKGGSGQLHEGVLST